MILNTAKVKKLINHYIMCKAGVVLGWLESKVGDHGPFSK